jgi:hypothetical protein
MPLIEGTLILLKDRTTKKVEDIKINDELITFSIDGLENIQNMDILKDKELTTFNGAFKESKIKNIWLDISDDIYTINDSLSLDGSHYLFVKRDDKYLWSKTEECIEGDKLFKIDNSWEQVNNIEKGEERLDVYNVQMNKVYNYFANGYLVHNGSPCDSCTACGAQEGGAKG